MTTTGRPAARARRTGRDERTEFLLQSLRDLEAEHDAGDIDDDDYAALRDDYTSRAAAALRAEERGRAPAVVAPSSGSWAQRIAVVAGLVAFAVVAGVLFARSVGDRQQGDGITGEVTKTPTQAAAECISLTTSQKLVEAVPCYQAVLEEDPDNAVARTYLGWTLYLTAGSAGGSLPDDILVGLYSQAHSQLDQAVETDPGYADARAFQIVLALREDRFEDAAAQLEAFDDLDAPADVVALVDGVRQRITDGLAGTPPEGSDPTTTAPGGGSPPGSDDPAGAPPTTGP